jgi:fibronectin type 3 domain-containing protein
VTAYHIERAPAGGTFAEIATVAGNQTTYQDPGLLSGTAYFYRVRAANVSAFSGYSPVASASTLFAPPGAPTGLTATAVSPNGIDLSWNAASGSVDRYRIHRRTGAAAYAVIDSVAGGVTSYADGGLTESTTYSYQVDACNAGGCSAPSAEASATTLSTPLQPPTAFTASATSASAISLTWDHDAAPAASLFEIERAPASDATAFAPLTSVPGTDRAYSDTPLTAATTYHYRVRACSGSACTAWTPTASATTLLAGTPPVPSNVTATAVSSTEVLVSWSPVIGVTHYAVRRRVGTGGGWDAPVSVAGGSTDYLDTTVSAATTYQYQVRACVNTDCSDFSSVQTVTTPP